MLASHLDVRKLQNRTALVSTLMLRYIHLHGSVLLLTHSLMDQDAFLPTIHKHLAAQVSNRNISHCIITSTKMNRKKDHNQVGTFFFFIGKVGERKMHKYFILNFGLLPVRQILSKQKCCMQTCMFSFFKLSMKIHELNEQLSWSDYLFSYYMGSFYLPFLLTLCKIWE